MIVASSHVVVKIPPRGFFIPEWHNSHYRTAKIYPEGMTVIVQLPRRRPQKIVRVGLVLSSQQLFISFIQSFVLTFGLSFTATPCTVFSNQQIEQRIATSRVSIELERAYLNNPIVSHGWKRRRRIARGKPSKGGRRVFEHSPFDAFRRWR